MGLFLLLCACGIVYGLFDLFVAKGSRSTDAFIANAIFNSLGAILPLIVFALFVKKNSAPLIDKNGWIYNILAGVAIATFSIIVTKIFARGGELGYVLPTVYGIGIASGALLGVIFLHEKMPALQIAGIVLTLVGISLIAITKH